MILGAGVGVGGAIRVGVGVGATGVGGALVAFSAKGKLVAPCCQVAVSAASRPFILKAIVCAPLGCGTFIW